MKSNYNKWTYILLIFSLSLICFVLLSSIVSEGHAISLFSHWDNTPDAWMNLLAIIIALVSAIISIYEIVSTHIKTKTSKFYNLVEYSKKRAEIEQEIARLTLELSRSDVSEYLNLNHLIFSAQKNTTGNGAINYNQFLNQFGIDKEKIQTKKDYAIFLTPFDEHSTQLFRLCSSILNEMGVLLQRTDTIVDKNDIMMNIVTQIVCAEFIIVNIDGRNPNVYYELGIAHAIGKPTILISKTDYPDSKIGFDIRQKQIVLYKDEAELEKGLLYQINRIRNQSDK